ncbi:MAG: O-antigen ligase family protein, partial [Deltaproteobacteria bacterium]|nr:O-antigen ligase family protein [Deltaproteobacteria bacterium]
MSITTARELKSLEQSSSWGRRIIIGISGAILIFAPLAYGAVHTWAYFSIGLVTAVASLTMLAWLLYKIYAKPQDLVLIPYPPLWWLAVGLVILTALQVHAWPQGWVARLSPKAWEIRALGNGYGLADFIPLSLNPYATWLEGLKLWPPVVLFFMLIYTIDNRRKLQGMVGLILAVALFEVCYGFWHFRSHLIWGWKNTYTRFRLCGTFINSNHLATFLTMAILLGFGLFLGLRETAPRLSEAASFRERTRRWSRSEQMEPQLRRYLLLLLLLLLAVGLIFTGSRGGMVSLVMGFGLMALLIWSRKWQRGYIVIMVAFMGAALLYSLFLGSEPALDRFSYQDHDTRYQAFKGALAIFKEFPIFGSGIATFGDLFYRFEPGKLKGSYFLQTHSDWLQLLAETGLPGFSLVIVGWVVFFSVLARQWSRRQQGFARGLALGGIAALSAGVFHALMEFPFHIPAISLGFAGIAALTYSAAHYHHQGMEFYSYRTLKLSGNHRVPAALLVLAVMGLQLAFGVRVCYNWMAEQSAPTEINSTRTPLKLAAEDFRQALRYNTINSKYYLGLAETLAGGVTVGGVASGAENSLKSAIFYAPANWGYRLKMAEFYLGRFQDAPNHYIPSALKELAAAV